MGFDDVGQAPRNVEESNALSSAGMRTREEKKPGNFILQFCPYFFFFAFCFFFFFCRILFWIFGVSFGIEEYVGRRREVVLQMVFSALSFPAIVPNSLADTGNLEFDQKISLFSFIFYLGI